MKPIGRHHGYFDPNDPEVVSVTPQSVEKDRGIDLAGRDRILFDVRDASGRKYYVYLDWVEMTFGLRPYFRCPGCEERRHKLIRPPGEIVLACWACWKSEGVVRYACEVRSGDTTWEAFAKHEHNGRRLYEELKDAAGEKRVELLLEYTREVEAANEGKKEWAALLSAELDRMYRQFERDERTHAKRDRADSSSATASKTYPPMEESHPEFCEALDANEQ